MSKLIDKLREKREPIIDQCKKFGEADESCSRIDGNLCSATFSPSARWKLGPCNLATHVISRIGEQSQQKIRIGQQKQKKKTRK